MKHLRRFNETLYQKPKDTFFDIDETTTEEILSMIEFINKCHLDNKNYFMYSDRWDNFIYGYKKSHNSDLISDVSSDKIKDNSSLNAILYRIQKEYKDCLLLIELIDDFQMFIDIDDMCVKFDFVIDHDIVDNDVNVSLELEYRGPKDARFYSNLWNKINFVSDRYDKFIISKITPSTVELKFLYEL